MKGGVYRMLTFSRHGSRCGEPGGEQRGILEHQEQSDSPIGLLQSGNSQICAVESSADGGK